MRVICMAVAEEPRRRENLLECINLLGGTPKIGRDTISVDYVGPQDKADQMVTLFEQFVRSEIIIQN